MLARRGAGEPRPNLLEPRFVVLNGEQAEHLRREVGRAITARLSLHQDELDVVLDDRVRLVRLPEERGSVALGLQPRVGDLVPDDGCQVVITHETAVFLDRGMERDDSVPATVLPPREADIAHHTDQPAARYEGVETPL